MKKLFIKNRKDQKISTRNKYDEKLVGIKTPAYLPPKKSDGTYEKTNRTVILVHGFGVTKEEGGMFDQLAEKIATTGITVYRFDFSGCGESEGDYSETSLTKLTEDLDSIIKYVKLDSSVDNSRIGILAQSFGTVTTIALSPDVKTIIMMGSVYSLEETLGKIFGNGYNPSGISIRTKPSGQVIKIKPQFWTDFKKYDLINCIKKINYPILFIHGSEDDKVPLSNMETYYENANKPKEKIILKGADHGLRPKREEMYKIAVKWFQDHL